MEVGEEVGGTVHLGAGGLSRSQDRPVDPCLDRDATHDREGGRNSRISDRGYERRGSRDPGPRAQFADLDDLSVGQRDPVGDTPGAPTTNHVRFQWLGTERGQCRVDVWTERDGTHLRSNPPTARAAGPAGRARRRDSPARRGRPAPRDTEPGPRAM